MKIMYWGSVALFFIWLFVATSGFIPIDQFDTALRLLASHYVSQGLMVYKDIGIVYPPGMAWLFGFLIPFGSIAQFNALSATAFLCISLVVCRFWGTLVKQNLLSMAFLFLVLATFVRYILSEPFSLLLAILLCVVHMYYLECNQSKRFLLGLGFTSAALAFFRWDTGLLYIFVMGSVVIFQSVLSRTLKKDMCVSLLAIFAGYLMAVSLLFFVFSGQNIVNQAYDFIFTIPTQIILPYRRLPLPGFQSPHLLNGMIYVAGLVYLILLIQMAVEKFKTKTSMFSLIYVFPTLFLPYALGRADWTHAIPFFCSVILVLGYAVSFVTKIQKQRILLLCIVLLLPSYLRLTVIPLKDILVRHQDATTELQSQLAECNFLTKDLQAKTLFVGRERYDRYIYSAASLYFLRPELHPATRYISDEPGLQNSCDYGQLIYNDLLGAKKPMIALLEQGEQLAEKNRTATMKNCGRVEKFLQEQPHEKIGECTAYTRLFSVEVYK